MISKVWVLDNQEVKQKEIVGVVFKSNSGGGYMGYNASIQNVFETKEEAQEAKQKELDKAIAYHKKQIEELNKQR